MRRDLRLPFSLSVSFTTIIQTLSLSTFLPVPVALLAGAGWGVAVALLALRLSSRVRLSAWLEDILVALGVGAMALFAFGGATGLLMLGAALDSPSLTGQTLVMMFLPSIPVAILGNTLMELVVVPALLILAWRPGWRRILVLATAVLFFALRVWSYVVFVSARLDFAETERSTTVLSAAERARLGAALHVDDLRWLLNLAIFAILLLAAYFSRVREQARDQNHGG